MATTYVDYTATAAQTDFAFTFDYLEDEHVTVEIDGAVQDPNTYSLIVESNGDTKIRLDSGATVGQKVRVRRKSQPDTDLVDFENGSVLTESELDRAYLHNRYLNEEIAELNDASLQKAVGSDDFTASNNKIKDVVDPVDAQDAATKNYVDTNDALQVTKTGDSMTGALAMGSNKITGLGEPTLTDDATTKTYVDNKVNQVSSGASAPPTKWVFTGDAGSNTTYSVTGAEVEGDTAYDVSIDGAVKEPTTDYTVDPDTDTLTIVTTLSGGEDIVVIERGFGVAITSGTIQPSQISAASNNVLLGNDNGTNQNIQELSATEARALLNVADGATANTGTVTLINTGTGLIGGPISASGEISIGTSGVGETQLAPGAVTSSKISDSDNTFKVSTTDVVINEGGADIDFRVEGDTNTNLIVADAGEDAVGIAAAAVAGIALNVGGSQLLDGNIVAQGTGAKIIRATSTNSTAAFELYANGQAVDQKRFLLSMGDTAGEFTLAAQDDDGTAGFVWNFNITDGSFNPDANNSQNCGSTGSRWQNVKAYKFNVDGEVIWTSGSGTPEGVVTAPVGSLFSRTDGGSGTSLYVKESGTGSTGWVAK